MISSGGYDPGAVAHRLRQARGSLSQREVGERLGYLQPHISRYERGEIPGSYRFLAGLSTEFGIDIDWVLTGRPPTVLAASEAQDDLRRFVQQTVRETLRESSEDRYAARAALTVSPTVPGEHPWDRLAVELPLLILSLVNGSSGAVEAPVAPEAQPADGGSQRLVRLLAAMRGAAEREDLAGALDELAAAASELEHREPSPVNLERARFLLLWGCQLAASGRFPPAGRAGAEAGTAFRLGRVTRKTGRLDEAEAIYTAAHATAVAAGEERFAARCHAGLGNLHFERGDFERARTEYVALLEGALRLGSPDLLFRAYLDLSAYYHEHEHDLVRAADYARQGLVIARRVGDLEHEARFLNELGLNAMEGRDPAGAESLLREALALASRFDVPLLRAVVGNNLGELQLRTGALGEAEASLLEARSRALGAGIGWAEMQAEILLARLDHAHGRTAGALDRLDQVQERTRLRGLAHESGLARAAEREIRRGLLVRLEAMAS
ncbi:MAG: tetratricopeptide repeat protein [Gemmatimonadetes bacterium]|nr:tetratricopeptide repeat protein [Gemmatimonadota bacterium]